MKGLLVLTAALTLIGIVSADPPNYARIPTQRQIYSVHSPQALPGWIEKNVWIDTDSGWADLGLGNPGAKARCWTRDTFFYGACNKELWQLHLENEASVAQWMELRMNGDGFHWGVRKVGKYAADCCWFRANSNAPLVITFSGFDDLTPCKPESTPGNPVLEAEYAFTDSALSVPLPDDDQTWIQAGDVNDLRWYVPDSVACNGGFTKHIWTTIKTDSCTPCADFCDNDATIDLTLQCIQPWIDRETGDFARMPDFPLQ